MAQDYGAAQPIYDALNNVATHVKRGLRALDRLPNPYSKPQQPSSGSTIDKSYMQNMVDRANQSFRDAAARDAAKKGSVSKPKATPKAVPGSFKRGGVVQKTGMAKVHKGERVLTVKQAAKKKK